MVTGNPLTLLRCFTNTVKETLTNIKFCFYFCRYFCFQPTANRTYTIGYFVHYVDETSYWWRILLSSRSMCFFFNFHFLMCFSIDNWRTLWSVNFAYFRCFALFGIVRKNTHFRPKVSASERCTRCWQAIVDSHTPASGRNEKTHPMPARVFGSRNFFICISHGKVVIKYRLCWRREKTRTKTIFRESRPDARTGAQKEDMSGETRTYGNPTLDPCRGPITYL